MYVKSFVDPGLAGTKIHECHVDKLPPLIVHKENQCLISCKVTDYTFIHEEQLGIIFRAISESKMRINVMQNSAISFSFCVDYRENRVLNLISLLSNTFEVFYNTGLTLVTVKNYDQKTFNEYRGLNGVILGAIPPGRQLQVLVKDLTVRKKLIKLWREYRSLHDPVKFIVMIKSADFISSGSSFSW